MTRWRCLCGWAGTEPSITDTSSERENLDGTITVDRTHLAVCPQCFELLKRSDAEWCHDIEDLTA
jgi:hypothetical protein